MHANGRNPRFHRAYVPYGTMLCVILLSGALLATGCGGRVLPELGRQEALLQDPATIELQGELTEFHAFFDRSIQNASDRIRRESPEARERRLALLWRVTIDGYLRTIQRNEVPQAALLDYLALATRQEEYLSTGEGTELFGERQDIALEAAMRIRERAEQLAQRHIPDDKYDEVASQIDEYAEQNPFTGEFASAAVLPFSFGEMGAQTFDFVVGLPLMPFRTLGRVGEGADSFRVFAQATDRFTNQMATLPEDVRSQMELLLLDLEENPRVVTAITSVEEIAASTTRYADLGERLPDEVRVTIREAFEQGAEIQPEVQETLVRAETALKEAREVTDSARELAAQVDQLGLTWRDTAQAFSALAKDVNELTARDPDAPPPDPDAPPARPFDIREYIATGQTAIEAVQEIRGLLADAAAVAEAGLLPEQVARTREQADATVVHTTAQLRQLVDRALIGAGLLALWIFGLMVGYRIITGRSRANTAA